VVLIKKKEEKKQKQAGRLPVAQRSPPKNFKSIDIDLGIDL
jgi:hypothetical protein